MSHTSRAMCALVVLAVACQSAEVGSPEADAGATVEDRVEATEQQELEPDPESDGPVAATEAPSIDERANQPLTGDDVGSSRLAASGDHSCFVPDDGQPRCWGARSSGRLGDGSMGGGRSAPVRVEGIDDAHQISSGNAHTCVVREGGRVSCWGWNNFSQIGMDPTRRASAFSPATSPDIMDAVEVAAGGLHTCVVRGAGTLSCWGDNAGGQLGDGTRDQRSAWETVVGLDDVVSAAGGLTHTCVAHADGSVSCWGVGGNGELGLGDGNVNAAMPTRLADLDDVVSVTAGTSFTCALHAGGTVSCWGSNASGQLGATGIGPQHAPLLVAGIEDAIQIDAAQNHVCALHATATVSCWGGLLLEDVREGIELIEGVVGAGQVAAGANHGCALTESDGVLCWGVNESGQIDGSSSDGILPPTPVPGLR